MSSKRKALIPLTVFLIKCMKKAGLSKTLIQYKNLYQMQKDAVATKAGVYEELKSSLSNSSLASMVKFEKIYRRSM